MICWRSFFEILLVLLLRMRGNVSSTRNENAGMCLLMLRVRWNSNRSHKPIKMEKEWIVFKTQGKFSKVNDQVQSSLLSKANICWLSSLVLQKLIFATCWWFSSDDVVFSSRRVFFRKRSRHYFFIHEWRTKWNKNLMSLRRKEIFILPKKLNKKLTRADELVVYLKWMVPRDGRLFVFLGHQARMSG